MISFVLSQINGLIWISVAKFLFYALFLYILFILIFETSRKFLVECRGEKRNEWKHSKRHSPRPYYLTSTTLESSNDCGDFIRINQNCKFLTCKMVDVVDELSMECNDTEEIIPNNPEQLAELKKENGNQLFKIKQYRSALPLYTEAIELCPETAAYYGNRAACYIMLNNFRDALEDARKSVQLDQSFIKGYQRIIKCGIALGDIMTAEQAVKKVKELDTTNVAINNEIRSLEILKQYESEAQKAYDKKDFRKVVYCMDRCLDQASTCARYKIQKAECLAFLG
ncbi:hypothetical protein ILUMI_02475, partial [Ignelater luminosus]